MKLSKIFMGITAAAMFAACSSDDIIAQDPTAGAFDDEGNGYIKIGINLPNVAASTRGIGDYYNPDNNNYPGAYGEYNDGEKFEYAVENAILCLFSKSATETEGEAKLIGAYQLGAGAWNENPSAEITTDRTFVQQINNQGANGELYAYVILNKHSYFEVTGNTLTFKSGKADATTVTLNNKTFADLMACDIKESGRRYDTNSFMMTNMPYASVPGGNQAVASGVTMKTLYPINTAAVYPTQIAAENGDAAAEVNVERVLAKVQTNFKGKGDAKNEFLTEASVKKPGHDAAKMKVKLLGWFIDNTNPNTYVARHYEDPNSNLGYLHYYSDHMTNPTYRFVSRNHVTTGAYRTFWAIDANYNQIATDLITKSGTSVDTGIMKFDLATGNKISGDLRENGSYYYCTENTFDVAHQSERNTTRVVVAAQVGEPDADGKYPCFYTIEQEANTVYSLDEIKAYTKARIADRVAFQQWVAEFCNSNVTDATNLIEVNLSTDGDAGSHVAGLATASMGEAPLNFTQDMCKGTLATALEAYKRMVIGDKTEGQVLMGCNDYLKENFRIQHYEGGVAYYHVLIKHFGDDETPWSKEAHAGVTNDIAGVYQNGGGTNADTAENAEAHYLGRYGVVRNNWYFIDVEGVRQIGSPVVPVLRGHDPEHPGDDPETPDYPDDQVENYLKVKINITPWAIRKQKVVL